MDQFPPLVMRAQAAARQAGFPLTREEAGPGRPSACLPGVGRFLAVLAAGCAGGQIGELGTGAGIGAGWIASAMPADCVLITVEIDESLARAARELLAADSRVEVITGDAFRVIPSRGPSICSSPTAGCATLQTLLCWSACSASAGASLWTT
jgi:predicted O-methyltransferase YrrM